VGNLLATFSNFDMQVTSSGHHNKLMCVLFVITLFGATLQVAAAAASLV